MLVSAKDFKVTKDMKEAAVALIACKAFEKTIRPIVEGYQRDILNRHQWHISSEWVDKGLNDEIILDPERAYELNDEDAAVYYAELEIEREKSGLYVKESGYCPLLVAKHEIIEAENILIETFASQTGINCDMIYNLETRREYIDLCLGLVMSIIN